MGLFGPKQVSCPAGRWATLISNSFMAMPGAWNMTFEAADGGPVAGRYVLKRTLWILPEPAEEGPLLPRMHFERKWINTFFSIQVLPERDLVVTID